MCLLCLLCITKMLLSFSYLQAVIKKRKDGKKDVNRNNNFGLSHHSRIVFLEFDHRITDSIIIFKKLLKAKLFNIENFTIVH